MSAVNLPELLALAQKVGREAAEILSDRPAELNVKTKTTARDIVTQMDVKAEKFIVDSILAARPGDGIIGEEGADRPSESGITWVIDPLDGTVNYFYDLPGWNVSIAAKDKDGALIGVVTAPTIGRTWWASRGGGAFCNGTLITCNDPIDFESALLASGFQYDIDVRPPMIEKMSEFLMRGRDLRRNGAAAVDICHVAMGAVDGYYEEGLNEWDHAAAGLIAQEAGAKVGFYREKPHMLTIAAGPALYAQIERFLGVSRGE
jgi:myo-inositol-1(or 4)-monophosphatase